MNLFRTLRDEARKISLYGWLLIVAVGAVIIAAVYGEQTEAFLHWLFD